MRAVSTIEGRAIPLGLKNVDTDVIIPAHWLKTVSREGLGQGAFETIRAAPGNPFDVEDFTRPNGETIAFEIDPFRKRCLLEGLDEIGLTLGSADEITRHEQIREGAMPWLDKPHRRDAA